MASSREHMKRMSESAHKAHPRLNVKAGYASGAARRQKAALKRAKKLVEEARAKEGIQSGT